LHIKVHEVRIIRFLDFRNSKYSKHKVSETGSISVLRRRENDIYSVGPFRNC
jgi:hypothetical protein